MAVNDMSPSDVKAICNELEKSPSCNNSKSSPIYHGGSTAAKSSGHSTEGKFGHSGVTGGKARKNVKSSKSPYTE
jgi:hypothetical protein